MARAGQDARRPPVAITAAGSFGNQAAKRLVGLAVVSHVLRSRRFYERAAVAAIVVGALRQIGQQNTASTMERLVAVNKRAIQREVHHVEHKAKLQARAVKTTRHMVASRPSKDLASKMRET